MKPSIILIALSALSRVAYAQDWANIPIPANAGEDKMWQLQENVSDDFSYTFSPVNSKTDFGENGKWYNFYHNHWDGPGTTYWKYNHVRVTEGNLIIKASRWTQEDEPQPQSSQANKMNKPEAGINSACVTSNAKVSYPAFVEASISVANIALASCFWLLSPDDTQEIDIIENYGGVDYFKQFTHISHHSFIRNPFHDYQPRDRNSWWPDSRVNGNYGWGDWCWNNGNRRYLRLGVHWVSPKHFEYYIDGEMVRTLYRNAIATKINNTWHYTYYNAIHPTGTTNEWGDNIGGQAVNDESGYSAVTTYSKNDDDYSFETLRAASKASKGICVIDPGEYQGGDGFTKAMDIIINLESQSWLVNQDKTPSDSDLDDLAKNEMRVDWIRVYSPIDATSVKETKIQSIEVFPNPAKEHFTIRLPKEVKGQNIRIYDVKGQEVYSGSFSGKEHQFQLNDNPGIYFLKAILGDEILQQKIIIECG